MSRQRRKFLVRIYEGEFQQLCQWTLKKKLIETGGDLFGLWHDDNSPVIQLVLGPGKHVRRSGVSFYQDVKYLEKIGSALTNDEGLCHIGEWHSHHQLGLAQPSYGDEETVWKNMPQYGLTKFFICISNIVVDFRGSKSVTVGCFFFECDPESYEQFPVLEGEFEIMPENSPFRVLLQDNLICRGAESSNKIMTDEQRNEYLEKVYSPKIKKERKQNKLSENRDYDGENDAVEKYEEVMSTWLWCVYSKLAYVCNIIVGCAAIPCYTEEDEEEDSDKEVTEEEINSDEFSDEDDNISNQTDRSFLSELCSRLAHLWEVFSAKLRDIWHRFLDYTITG